MAATQLIELEDPPPQFVSTFRPGHFSFPSTAIALKVIKPSLWGEDDAQAQLHDTRLSLGLHVPKRYLIIAQRADNDDSEIFLRFPIPLSDISYTISAVDDAARLVLEARSRVRSEIVYSDMTGTQHEREIERIMVHLNCTLSVQDFEKGTKFVVQAMDKSHEQKFHHIILGIAGLIDGRHYEHQTKGRSGQRSTPSSLDNVVTAAALQNANSMPVLLDPFESPITTPGDLLGEVIADIWEGLEQLDSSTTRQPAVKASKKKSFQAESNEFGNTSRLLPDLITSTQLYPAAAQNSSEAISVPVTPAEAFLDSNTPSSDAFYLPPTRDVSTIQLLPSAVFPPRHIPTISTMEPYIPSSSLQGTLAEQQLQQTWQTTNNQWLAIRKKSKYADAKATYISGPRRSNDARMDELRVDSSGELKGYLSSTGHEERNKENRGTVDSGQPESNGSGKGAFRNLSGKRAGRRGRTHERGRTDGRAIAGAGLQQGRGYSRYTGRGRAGRRSRGGMISTDDQRGNNSDGW